MKRIIKDCIANRKVVSLFTDQEDDSVHKTGIILCIDDTNLLMAHITPSGRYDGFIVLYSDDIFRIDTDGWYEKKIEMLYRIKKEEHPKLDIVNNNSIVSSMLIFAKSNNLIVSFELEDTEVTGFVKEEKKDTVSLLCVDSQGQSDGETIIKKDSFKVIGIDTEFEHDLLLLFRHNKEGQ